MYATQTEYHRAGSVQEAVSLLAGNEDAKVLAGGHSLIPLMKLRLASPALLVDIGHLGELSSGVTCSDGTITISSLTTPRHHRLVGYRAERLSDAGGGGGHDRRSGRSQSRHDRGQPRPLRPGVRPADGARGAWREHQHRRAGGRQKRVRLRLRPGADAE